MGDSLLKRTGRSPDNISKSTERHPPGVGSCTRMLSLQSSVLPTIVHTGPVSTARDVQKTAQYLVFPL